MGTQRLSLLLLGATQQQGPQEALGCPAPSSEFIQTGGRLRQAPASPRDCPERGWKGHVGHHVCDVWETDVLRDSSAEGRTITHSAHGNRFLLGLRSPSALIPVPFSPCGHFSRAPTVREQWSQGRCLQLHTLLREGESSPASHPVMCSCWVCTQTPGDAWATASASVEGQRKLGWVLRAAHGVPWAAGPRGLLNLFPHL